jgi:D-3-phosphoglycerate dehydrogenase
MTRLLESAVVQILIADALDASAAEALAGRGHQCRVDSSITDLTTELGGVDCLIVRSTRVGEAALRKSDGLKLVIRAGSGTNTIDVATATELGIRVSNVPGGNAMAVAELTMGLLLAVDRRIPDQVIDLRAGKWDKRGYAGGGGLWGRTMSILGLGDIGLQVAERAKSFGMRLASLDRPPWTDRQEEAIERLGIEMAATVIDLAQSSDVLSLHLPLTDETRGIVDRRVIESLPAQAILINTSRGELVDQAALLESLDRGLRAGLDVFPDEPAAGHAEWHSPLASHPNVVGTHHIGASTAQAQREVAARVVDVVDSFVNGRLLNCVNCPEGDR